SLETPSWRTNRLAGDGWMAVGDAGGLVDPITGEGLYYAIRSADLAAELLVEDKHPLDQIASVYRRIVWRGFGEDLTLAASLARRIFLGNFLFRSIPARTVQYMKRSPAFLAIMQDLVSGAQPYLTLRRRLLENLIKVHSEVWIWSSMGRFQPRGVSA
ncbi:MAG: hypothetical protein HY235_14020, partial [Acidobacteria bacterium]|nr:hypothetical protein [Acidobacteriota bacterium]